jgi:hypothetical protein
MEIRSVVSEIEHVDTLADGYNLPVLLSVYLCVVWNEREGTSIDRFWVMEKDRKSAGCSIRAKGLRKQLIILW